MDQMNTAGEDAVEHPPPTYVDTATTENLPPSYQPPASTIPDRVFPKFPSDIVIYHQRKSANFMITTPVEPDSTKARVISHVTVIIQKGWVSEPSLIFHSNNDPNSVVVGDVKFGVPSSDVTIYHTPHIGSVSTASHIKLTQKGSLTVDVHTFHMPGARGDEIFEWRHSGDAAVKALAVENIQGENIAQNNRGLKLVRVTTGEMVAAYAGSRKNLALNPRRVAGKVRFVGDYEGEEQFRLVALMTILCMMEKGRRRSDRVAGNFTPTGECRIS